MAGRNVLVFPAGTEIGLEIYWALHACKEVTLFAAGSGVSNHAWLLYPKYHVVPSVHESGWLDALVAICRALEIQFIIPAHDDVIVALCSERQRIPARVVAPSARTCEITRSKAATYRALEGRVRVPRTYSGADEVDKYPVLVKPDRGQGAFGATKVADRAELLHALSTVPEPIVCEYLPGREFTVDCFSDRERGVLFAGARIRNRMRSGIAVNTATVDLPQATEWAHAIGSELAMHGSWFFQVKENADGALVLLEVAPRIAGSMAAHRVQGVNFPLLSLFEEERLEVAIRANPSRVELDRALTNRYAHGVSFSSLYMDLDDTLIIDDRVNLDALRLVYKCINEGKRTILLTRHAGDLSSTLRKHRLTGVFDEVIHLSRAEKKSEFVGKDAIYVDDSFSERSDVASACGVPTFDTSMIEMLNFGRCTES